MNKINRFRNALGILILLGISGDARAQLTPQPLGAFGATTLEDLSTATEGAIVNGLTVGQLTFGFTVNGIASNNAVIDGGPGTTNNVASPNIVNNGGNIGDVLTVTLASPATLFGYGFANLNNALVPDGTTAEAFNGATSLGTLTFGEAFDPTFPGGFAGFSSATPFTSVELTFDPTALAFAADNFRFNTVATTPAPSSLTIFVGLSTVGAGVLRRRRKV